MKEKSLGISNTSYGEILQGRLNDGVDFLISFPCKLYSACMIELERNNDLQSLVSCDRAKVQTLVEYCILYEKIFSDLSGIFSIKIMSNIPIGRGMSSSTADLCATLRALEQLAGIRLKSADFSRIIGSIEPHDPVFLQKCCAYNHRRGSVIKRFQYSPNVLILSIDGAYEVDTNEFNKSLTFTKTETDYFSKQFFKLANAFKNHNDREIFQIASTAAIRFVQKNNDSRFKLMNFLSKNLISDKFLGFVIGHSGSCLGLVFEKSGIDDACVASGLIQDKFDVETVLIESLSNDRT